MPKLIHCLLLCMVIHSASGAEQATPEGTPTTGGSAAASTDARCIELSNSTFPDTVIDTAVSSGEPGSVPRYCEISGTVSQRIRFILRLPSANWNGKFMMTGCRGFCGSIEPNTDYHSHAVSSALKQGYATVNSDGGHESARWTTDWAIKDSRALELYAGAWMPAVVATGRAIISAYYLDEARRTYYTGCSNGGRLGLFAAQRYPDLFDGIAAGGASFDFTGSSGIFGLWLLQSVRDVTGKPTIDESKIPLLAAHVLKQCDAQDAVVDGIVSRPHLCQVNIEALQCEEEATENCMTVSEVRAIKRLYRGATAFGERQYPGVAPGSESNWPDWIIGTADSAALGERLAEGMLRMTYNLPWNEGFNPNAYNLGDELENLKQLAPILDATDPDLGKFSEAGGKLLVYQGWADPLVPPGRTLAYYSEVVNKLGAETLDTFSRFLFIPGHGHCWATPGSAPDEFDPLETIDRWVEHGEKPDRAIAVQRNEAGVVQRSRPLCPHPLSTVFKGGDEDLAENYACE